MTRDSAETRWISWREASELTGIPLPTIEHAGRVGRIARREAHGNWPTLDRDSVLEWAALYRAQKSEAEKRGRPRPKSRKTSKRIVRHFRETRDEEWLTTAEAAELLGTCEDTVRRMARSGKLTSRRERLWLVHREAVAAYAAEEARWMTWVEAAQIIGAPRHIVESWIRDGRLRTRRAPRAKPSVERLSAEALAIEWRAIVTEREAKRRARQRSQEARRRLASPPADGDTWLTPSQAADLLGCSQQAVRNRVHSERLPGVQVGGRIWLRQRDVEQAARAAAFPSSARSIKWTSDADR
jgi:excisionase family DNA binding protein